MRVAFLIGLFGLVSWAQAQPLSDTAPSVMTVQEWVHSMAGEYQILLVNGEKPKELSDIASVEDDSGEGVLSMPICLPDGICDPGYLFLDYGQAELDSLEIAPGHWVYTILVPGADDQVARYTWEISECSASFTNYQYRKPDQSVMVLQHVLKKKEPPPIEP